MQSLASPSNQSYRTWHSDELGQSPLSDPQALPSHISNHLFRAYFSCIHPIWPLIYKPLFDARDYAKLLEELPKALVFAMFAIAVSVQGGLENGEIKQMEDINPEIIFDAAIRALEESEGDDRKRPASQYLMKPTITHCQVLAILALQQHGVAEFSQAGILCGLASSIAIELRLHRKIEGNNPAEREIKSRLWWTIYVLETMLSCEMGRPTLLRYEESDTPFPSAEESDEFELYTPVSQASWPPSILRVGLKLRTLTAFHSSTQIRTSSQYLRVFDMNNLALGPITC
jgi:hypothetical protein